MMMKRNLALPLTVLAMVAAACTSSGTPTDEPGATTPQATDSDGTDRDGSDPEGSSGGSSGSSGPIGFAPASLQQFGDCAAFLDHVHAEGVERVGPYGLGGVFGVEDFAFDAGEDSDIAVADAAEADFDSATAESSSAATSDATEAPRADDSGDGTFSTTNVQVEGVDEPDIVKTDGERIVAIAGETLHYIDVADDGSSGTLRGSVELNGDRSAQAELSLYSYGHEIFLVGDRVFVFAQGEGNYFLDELEFRDDVAPSVEPPPPADATVITTTTTTTANSTTAEPTTTNSTSPTTVRTDEEAPSDTIDTPNQDLDAETDAVIDDAPDAEAGFARSAPAPDQVPDQTAPPIGQPSSPSGYVGPQTLVIEIDASDPDALSIVNTLSIDGRYISARSVGATARLVVTSPPQDLGFLYPSNSGTEDKAEETNREVILDSTASDWIPDYTLTDAAGNEQTGEIADCSGVHAPADFSGFDMLSVITLDLSSDLAAPTGGAAVLASGETVYASQDRLYVSTNIWEPIINEQTDEWLDENYQTALHRFSIAGDAAAAYEGSGSIDGHLLNQFSMNDRDGVLYAATTTGAPWGGGDDSVSQIVALELDGDQLTQIGSVGGLGETERIFSVRYVGDTAYVVTFRQTDPFYVVDLSDPRNMVVQGELKIPGYSSYLHPISADLVLGVGQDADDDGRTLGTKVSLFDVSDPTDPLEVDVWTLPDAYSDAEFDHRAFLWWAPTNTAVLPLQSYGDQFSGAVVLQVQDGAITEQGRITQADVDEGPSGQTDCRVLTRDDFGQSEVTDENGELDWFFSEGNQVNLCTDDQDGGATGMFCEVVPVDDLRYWYDGELDLDVSQFDRIEFCYSDWDGYRTAVQRTLVIDGSLWTLSPERLQSNDLTSLDRTAAIDLT